MNKVLFILNLPIMLADWLYSWTLQPLDNWWASLSPFTKVYIIMFALFYYLVYLIDKTRREFYAILTEEQQKKFISNTYRWGDPTWLDYLKGCWFGFGAIWFFYFIYKWIVIGITYLVGG